MQASKQPVQKPLEKDRRAEGKLGVEASKGWKRARGEGQLEKQPLLCNDHRRGLTPYEKISGKVKQPIFGCTVSCLEDRHTLCLINIENAGKSFRRAHVRLTLGFLLAAQRGWGWLTAEFWPACSRPGLCHLGTAERWEQGLVTCDRQHHTVWLNDTDVEDTILVPQFKNKTTTTV